ncbi:Rad and Gem GTP binding protein 1 [Fasciolopsis buskii]|uniref:Rad and Gem GTP binding protein 1 n=1 Tax=Fasciolopsis buskii TaxID=27845 RepID=A0A8E0SB12_9TREM|nr:Rad and Gem GTP binding protein 1 [Fasciolopsis buski]
MSGKRRSFIRWIKSAKVFRHKKLVKCKHTCDEPRSPDLPVNQLTVEEELDSEENPIPIAECTTQPCETAVPADDFDLFVQLSNSPTCPVPTARFEQEAVRIPLDVEFGRRLHFRPCTDRSTEPSSRNSLVNEDLRRVMSVIERKPSLPKPTSFRRDLARASFRSRSVRERQAARKIRHPWPVVDGDADFESRSPARTDRHQDEMKNDLEMEPTDMPHLYRVRSFKLTRKGVINLGDTFRTWSVVGLTSNQVNERINSELLLAQRYSDAETAPNSAGLMPTESFRFPRRSHACEFRQSGVDDTGRRSALKQENGLRIDTRVVDTKPNTGNEQPIRIQIVGSPNVGKTALCRQMITSEFLGAKMESMSEDTVERYVTVELDDQTWNIVLIDNFGEAGSDDLALVSSIRLQESRLPTGDSSSMQNTLQLLPQSKSSGSTILKDVLVYLLVFAVDDRRSFEYVSKLLQVLSKVTSDQLVMLVGNKADLVRCRSVPNEKGKRLAHLHGCKYFEVSTAINHLVDELLVGIILQVKKLRTNRLSPSHLEVPDATERRMSSLRLHGEAIVRYLRDKFDAKSCEDIQWA